MSERPISPVAITLTDGQERKFLLSLGGLKRVKEHLGAGSIQEVLNMIAKDVATNGPPMLWEALIDKTEMTETQLAELLPADIQGIMQAIMALLGVSLPEAKDRPTLPPVEPPVVN